MTLQEKINKDLKESILNGNTNKKDLLRVVIGELNRKGKILSDDIVQTELKKLKQNALDMNNNGEVIILNEYLPTLLSNDELLNIINNIISDNNLSSMRDMGKVMTELKNKYNAQYDGKTASMLIKKLL